jgi:hypothetical protein
VNEELDRVLDGHARRPQEIPQWDGRAAERIAAVWADDVRKEAGVSVGEQRAAAE